METVSCKALRAFTHFVVGHGQVHGNPEAKDKAAKTPEVPVSAVALLSEWGYVEAPKGFVDPDAVTEAAPAEDAPAV